MAKNKNSMRFLRQISLEEELVNSQKGLRKLGLNPL